jgi:cytochrome c oxidase subunit 2
MGLLVVAHSPDAFASWLAAQRLPAADPADDVARRGRDVFAANACGRCHTIRGVTDTAPNAGPDLTHFASRREILAGTAVNAAAELFTWLHDPAVLKEGTAMPSFDLNDADIRALVTYLESLE